MFAVFLTLENLNTTIYADQLDQLTAHRHAKNLKNRYENSVVKIVEYSEGTLTDIFKTYLLAHGYVEQDSLVAAGFVDDLQFQFTHDSSSALYYLPGEPGYNSYLAMIDDIISNDLDCFEELENGFVAEGEPIVIEGYASLLADIYARRDYLLTINSINL